MHNKTVIFENQYVRLELSDDNLFVKSVFDKVNNTDISGEKIHLFSYFTDNQTECFPDKVEFSDGKFTVNTAYGSFDVSVIVNDAYFAFELLSELPEEIYKVHLVHIKYNYDYANKTNAGAAGIAMTWWTNQMFYPDAKDRETCFEVLCKKSSGAKYALIIAPIHKHKDIIKEINCKIDRNLGIVNEKGGVYSRDYAPNYGNIITDFNTTPEWLEENIPYYKNMGVDIIDYHKNYFGTDPTFRQGDFKPLAYKTDEEFKKNVSDILAKNSMCASLHTYAYLVDFDCDTLLSDAEYRKDLKIAKELTLAKDINVEDEFIYICEDTSEISDEYGFVIRTTPFFLAGNEIIRFEKNGGKLKVRERGIAGTKVCGHKEGEKIYQIAGLFGCFNVVLGSELFFEVARQTARAYNDCGYEAIYIDALDSVTFDCNGNESEMAFYISAFVCEVLKYCKKPPTLDYSIRRPCNWSGRSRVGNFDTPYRGYKRWNKFHAKKATEFIDMYLNPSLGWYNFYGTDGRLPENVEIKYQHTDDVHHLGSLAVMYNCSMTYVEFEKEKYDTIPALRRNIAIYKKYDELRKSKCFSEDVLEKVRNGRYEYHINDKNTFVEKDFQVKKIYNVADNNAAFNNLFKKQKPFIRLEALLSCDDTAESKDIISFNKDEEITSQKMITEFAGEDFSKCLAKKVSVLGNGKKGAVAIKLRCRAKGAGNYTMYVIDTAFEGWRDFVLIETDKGERADLPFDECEWNYATYRFGCDFSKIIKAEVQTAGDVSGVKMSDVVAYPHKYVSILNPAVTSGNQKLVFNCELKSGEYIEFDGTEAKVVDSIGNESKITFEGEIVAEKGELTAFVSADNANNNILRAQLTLGFTGKEIK